MFDARQKWQIRQARKNLEMVEQQRDKRVESLEDEQDRAGAWQYLQVEIDPVEEEYRLLLTRYWTKQARDRFIPRPAIREDEEYWELTGFTQRWVLTDKGVSYLRSAIRQESMLSHEGFFRWAAIILGLLAVAIPMVVRFLA
jgi:hypothetical protein